MCPAVRHHDRIIVNVNDTTIRTELLRDVMHVALGGQSGANVDELANTRFLY